MYANLERELKANNYSYRAAAAAIGMAEPTFRTKMSGRRFSIEQAFAIKNRLFPKYNLEYLFANDDTSSEEADVDVSEETGENEMFERLYDRIINELSAKGDSPERS